MLIDTHCHLQFRAYENDRDEVILRCQEKGLIMNIIGTQKDTSAKAVELAEKYPEIYATVGLHPVHATTTVVDEEEINFKSREEKFDYEFYKKLASHPKVIAIGECGIELFHLPPNVGRAEIIAKHKELFLQQYKLARELCLPIVIHVRDAYDELLQILQSEILNLKSAISGVVHCFSGNWQQAQKYLDLGLYLGFTGIISFPALKTNPRPNLELLGAVKQCPLDKMLVETDAPYLAPQKYRGERAEPWMVEEVVKKIAEIKELSEEEVREKTFQNALDLFKKIRS